VIAAAVGLPPAGAASDATTVWLPDGDGGPMASPELIRDQPPPTAETWPDERPDGPDDALPGPDVGAVSGTAAGRRAAPAVARSPWRVPTLATDPALLLRLTAGPTPDGVALSASVGAAAAVARLAEDLVRRGRVLPVVQDRQARWRPLPAGPDTVAIRRLAVALPPALLAAMPPGPSTPDTGPSPGTAGPHPLAAMLDELTDLAARRLLAGAGTGRRPRPAASASPAVAAWLAALTGGDPRIAADPAAVDRLAAELDGWLRDATGGAVRACFRLVEPSELPAVRSHGAEPATPPGGSAPPATHPGDGAEPAAQPGDGAEPPWTVQFLVQAADESSLLVEADAVWRSRGPLRALARLVDDPQETFLAELGRAARLYPDLKRALRQARPRALEMDTAGAHRFLATAAPRLSAAGFGVQLPSWWTAPPGRLGLRLRASTPAQPGVVAGSAGLTGSALAEFSYELALGGQALSERELKELAALKAPLVRMRGHWVEVDQQRIAAGLAALDRRGTIGVTEVLRIAAGTDPTPDGVPVTEVVADGWLGRLLAEPADRTLTELPTPSGFRGRLRPYQQRGLDWLAFLDGVGLGGILADDMGLGKTVQMLALIAAGAAEHGPAGRGTAEHGPAEHGAAEPAAAEHRAAEQGAADRGPADGAGPTLLVCPMSVVSNWQREAERFTPDLRVYVHHGVARRRGDDLAATLSGTDLVITTYAIAARDAVALAAVPWRRVVLDEAQAIKNAAAKQSAALRRLPARTKLALTGTPVENRLADLWSILDFTNPGILGTAAQFRTRYAVPIERHGDEQAADRLRRFTSAFVLRRLKTDKSIIADLPEKLEMEVMCNLTAEQASLYQAVVDDMLAKIDQAEGIGRRGLILATMTKLKQVCNHPAHFLRDSSPLAGRSGKLALVEDIVDEILSAQEKALLFTQYAEFGSLLRSHLAGRFGREVLLLHGGVSRAERDRMVQRFQAGGSGSPALLVLSLKAGGTGLTLTAANHVVHVDRWWNPAVEDQATDRAYRIGQRKAVQVRKLVTAGTLEERIAAMIRDKRGLAARIVGSGEDWLTDLTTSQLRELVALNREAVTA
jgi:non-specific serine/threonine protein kinase